MIVGDRFQGGATWAVLGLRRLGHEVYLVEPIKAGSLRPAGVMLAGSVNAAYFWQIVSNFGLEGAASLLDESSMASIGLNRQKLQQVARRADLLINISGMLTEPELIARIPVRAYLDLDPAFIQMWHAIQGIDMRFAAHTHFVTIGQAIGGPGCAVPTCGREWITTPQPIVLERWPVAGPVVRDALTTIGNWRGYGSIEHQGVFYGQKAHSLRPLMDLPKRTPVKFLLAMAIHAGEHKDLAALAENGWELIDPQQVAGTPDAYQGFVQGSWAEFGIAKSGYAASQCGWFSDRSVCYLASGRPVLAQETGFSRFLPTGEGLLSFATADDVLAGIEELRGDYLRHARAARELAEEFFDSDKVLERLLGKLGVA
jgi:hypothetical protein